VPLASIRRARAHVADPLLHAGILADICRINALYMITLAGSGHIGSSFSSMDVLTWLWTARLDHPTSGQQDSDTYFSSKGHDAPALYSLLLALEKLDFALLHRLRRFGGLPGHPDVHTPFIAANTGSLGMGISKARHGRAQRPTGAADRSS
jgi:transketolase